MIQIDFHVGDNTYELSITGHAGYSTHGNDIVCAGVSAITFTLLGFLDNHMDDIESISAQTESGRAHVVCKGGGKTALAFDMALIGLQQIAMKYPKHVTVDIHPAPGG
jgi:uncharacterized protein YsxB (DUF464 family)